MGTVHAKEPDRSMRQKDLISKEELGTQSAKIQRLVVKGLCRTKEDVLQKIYRPVFEATTLKEMQDAIYEATSRIDKLEIFKKNDIKYCLDIYKGPGARPDGYELKINVEEKYFTGGTSAQLDRNNAYMQGFGKLRNLFGRGESLSAVATVNPKYGFNKELGSQNLVFLKPVGVDTNYMFSADLFRSTQEYSWSGYKEKARGIVLGYKFPLFNVFHNIQWNGIWRDLHALSPSTSFAVREESGHTLKSSIKYTIERDRRDNKLVPNEGSLLRIMNEYAGVGGNVEFRKHDVEFQIGQKILNTIFQVSLAGGVMKSLDQNKDISINDRFFIGGPTSLRGFNFQGVGPHINGNALGADAYWLCGLHVYRPLPFRLGQGRFGELFRTHLFVNAGNLVNIDLSKTAIENFKTLSETYRLSYGGGIVLMIGNAKLELNYVIPIRSMSGDRLCSGLQFGVGIEFL